MSPDAGKISPGIMSACNQSYSAQYGKSAHGAQGELPDRPFGGKSEPDANCMKRRSGASETRGIRNKTNRCGFSPMDVAVKEREKSRDCCTQPNRGFYGERD
jgi:hypothetical protein